jgi:hypothetical protein
MYEQKDRLGVSGILMDASYYLSRFTNIGFFLGLTEFFQAPQEA